MASFGVAEYYADKTIFITGATGFIGKVLMEKLLRCCPDVKAIYLLTRTKKGLSPQKRLEEIVNNRCFEKVQDSKLLSKLHVTPGDILEEDLGLSVQDKCMIQKEVQIVFHSAAMVRFDLGLRDAITTNVIGTKRVLELAEGIVNLEVFLQTSTTYCHDEIDIMEEKVYPPIHRPQDVIDCVKWMNDDVLDTIQTKLIKPYVNTYGYSKNITEGLVSEYNGKFPIVIARPSIVTAAYKEPLPGWVDNINGPTGAAYAAASGLIHTNYCKDDVKPDIVPVDIAANGCILLAYITGTERPKDIRVCNMTGTAGYDVTWMQGYKITEQYIFEYPLSRCLWYPAIIVHPYLLQHKIVEVFLHILPAYFIDFLLFLFGQKTFMVRIEKRIRKGLDMLHYYHNKNWIFKNDYFQSLRKHITEKENEIFYTDIAKIDTVAYIRDSHLGLREFIAKEDISTLPKARKHMKRLYVLHMTVKTLFYTLLAYFMYCLIIKFF